MQRKGFTLIELLVVVAIITVLAGMSIFGLQGARESARDARRKSDLESVRSALELYKSDCGVYPTGTISSSGTQIGGTGVGSCANANVYLESFPSDPSGTGRSYYYSSSAPYTSYLICAALENETTAEPTCGSNCGAGVNCSYIVNNP